MGLAATAPPLPPGPSGEPSSSGRGAAGTCSLPPEALRAALRDLADFGFIYAESAADAWAVAALAPVPVRVESRGAWWRVEEVRGAS